MVKRELKKETSELFITVSADKQVWKDEQAKSFNELKNNLEVKGYRRGNVPIEIAKKQISQKDIWSKTVNKMLDEMAKTASTSITDEDKILDAPTYNINKISENELEIDFIYPIYPKIQLANYKQTNIKFSPKTVNPDLITKELNNLREKHALLQPKTGAIAMGDLVKFDFDGYVDGQQFEGGKSNDYILEIGSKNFIAGFEEQMVGLKVGDEKDINVTFPENYHVETLKGKAAIFKIKIHEIKTKNLPELNDEFAKEVAIDGVNNLEELNKYLESQFVEKTSMESKHEFISKLFDQIKADTKIVVPQQLIMREMQAINSHFENNLKRQKWTINDYLKRTGTSKEDLMAEFRKQAQERLTDSFLFAEIARIEEIKPTEEDFEIQYEKLAKIYKKPVEEIKKLVTKSQAQVPIINEKVIDKLIELNQ